MTAPDVGGLVLAGGAATRFGSDKLQAMVAGRPLLHHPVTALAHVAAEIVVVAAHGAAAPSLPAAPGVPVRVVHDPQPGQGPLAGLVTGLEALRRPLVVVAAGDQPDLAVALLQGLVGRAVAGEATAVLLLDGQQPRPLPCVVRREAALRAGRARLSRGERSLHGLLEILDAEGVPETEWRSWDPGGAWRRDIDRPEDLLPV